MEWRDRRGWERWGRWVARDVVRQAHQGRWVRSGCWVALGPGPIRQAQGRLDAGMAGEEDGRVGVGCWEGWFDTTLRGLRVGSPRTVGWAGGLLPGRGRLETGPYARAGRGRGGWWWKGWRTPHRIPAGTPESASPLGEGEDSEPSGGRRGRRAGRGPRPYARAGRGQGIRREKRSRDPSGDLGMTGGGAGMAGGGGKGRVRLPEPGWRAVPLANVRRGCLVKRRTSR